MKILQGYAYHIKDSYFEKVKDSNLMQNKVNGKYRPIMYCIKDANLEIYWMVPITFQCDKYFAIREKILHSGKLCKGIIVGEFDGQKSAFLIQNMFPTIEEYIEHIHTKNGNPVPMKRNCRR